MIKKTCKPHHKAVAPLNPYIGHSNPLTFIPIRQGGEGDSLRQLHLPNLTAGVLARGFHAAAITSRSAALRASHSCGHVADRSLQKPILVVREGALGAQAHPVAEQHPTDGQVRHLAA